MIATISLTALLAGGLLAGCNEFGINDRDSEALAPVWAEETFVQAPVPALDILFVVDGTGSMSEEHASLAAAADHFVAALAARDLDWQIGVTGMDAAEGGALRGEPWILTPVTPDPAAALAAALLAGGEALPPEAGFASAIAALDAAEGTGSTVNAGFRRETAALHLIFVSDGDDQSGPINSLDPAAALLARLDAEAARTGRAARASAVVGDLPAGCDGVGGRAAPGVAFSAVAGAAGGIVRSICIADYGSVAAEIGEVGVEWQRIFTLQADPAPGTVRVEVDGARVAGWTISGRDVTFEAAPPGGALITVGYTPA